MKDGGKQLVTIRKVSRGNPSAEGRHPVILANMINPVLGQGHPDQIAQGSRAGTDAAQGWPDAEDWSLSLERESVSSVQDLGFDTRATDVTLSAANLPLGIAPLVNPPLLPPPQVNPFVTSLLLGAPASQTSTPDQDAHLLLTPPQEGGLDTMGFGLDDPQHISIQHSADGLAAPILSGVPGDDGSHTPASHEQKLPSTPTARTSLDPALVGPSFAQQAGSTSAVEPALLTKAAASFSDHISNDKALGGELSARSDDAFVELPNSFGGRLSGTAENGSKPPTGVNAILATPPSRNADVLNGPKPVPKPVPVPVPGPVPVPEAAADPEPRSDLTGRPAIDVPAIGDDVLLRTVPFARQMIGDLPVLPVDYRISIAQLTQKVMPPPPQSDVPDMAKLGGVHHQTKLALPFGLFTDGVQTHSRLTNAQDGDVAAEGPVTAEIPVRLEANIAFNWSDTVDATSQTTPLQIAPQVPGNAPPAVETALPMRDVDHADETSPPIGIGKETLVATDPAATLKDMQTTQSLLLLGSEEKLFTLAAEPKELVEGRSPLGASPAQQVAAAIATHKSSETPGLIELTLTPEDLGTVRFEMKTDANGMSITLTAERPETLDLMRRNLADLIAELKQAGVQTSGFSFGSWSGRPQYTAPEPPSLGLDPDGPGLEKLVPAFPNRMTRPATQGLDLRL